LRIVYLHQYFNTPNMAGGTRSYEMSTRWAAQGHDVHVVTSTRTSKTSQSRWTTTEVDGVTIHWRGVPYSNGMNGLARLWAFLTFALVSGPRVRSLNGDAIFATSTPLTVILPALFAKFRRKTPIVFEVRDLWPELPIAVGALRNPIARWLARWLELVAYRRSARIVALSEDMADGVAKRGIARDRIVVAPNACDIVRFSVPADEGRLYRDQSDWLRGRDLVVYCGALGKINGVEYLVRLAAEMSKGGFDPAFAIYGSGREESSLRHLAQELGVLDQNLYMMGKVAKAEVPRILSAATVCTSLFLPIREMQANSANKFFDALAAHRPIAINYRGWQADLIQSEGIGLLLDPGDVSQAATTLADFLSLSSIDQQQVGEAAGRVGRERFDRDMISMRVLNAITESAGRQSH